MSKIKGNQGAVEVYSVLGMRIDVLKHYDNSFRDPRVFTTSLRHLISKLLP